MSRRARRCTRACASTGRRSGPPSTAAWSTWCRTSAAKASSATGTTSTTTTGRRCGTRRASHSRSCWPPRRSSRRRRRWSRRTARTWTATRRSSSAAMGRSSRDARAPSLGGARVRSRPDASQFIQHGTRSAADPTLPHELQYRPRQAVHTAYLRKC
eukprot:4676884-Prymnesium_polylepis.1